MSTEIKPKHIGRNISRIRELRDMKQEALAIAIGTTQQSISIIEGSESVDDEKLKAIAEALGVPAEVIRNFSEEAVFNIIGNTAENNSSVVSFGCTFNPLDKLLEAFDKNEKLYERLVESEKEKVAILEKLLSEK
ncbi:helix-turn-helix domain-containing protein [Flavobacterium pectinovorum]|jgi:transcriptional regulator with XRE-family HTH domain|uniref:XRE family transcriptional regulator n=1 Tax=Flavobacterium pectinovorum TaxID=29533 RepID=A0A502EIL0_9FLAO|nr:helix-turn-helix transcriptional regulator [Flavobacterium pectinovorum]TPG36336.1 XRE family transcriptional regulator [Flavobacterium pectinovorum]